MTGRRLMFRLSILAVLGFALTGTEFTLAAVMTCDNKRVKTNGELSADFYRSTDGRSGKALKKQLYRLISTGMSKCTYKEVWTALEYTDEDPSNQDNVILFYTGRSTKKTDKYKAGKEPDKWTREHIWPVSRGFKKHKTNPAYTDLHHIRPADKSVNADRNDRDYDMGGQLHCEAPSTFWDNDSWEPRAKIKGDAARMIFYMAVRYEGDEPFVPDLTLVERTTDSGCPHFGKLCVLLRWHLGDPVDDRERERHRKVVQIQGNRNPFIDRPDFAKKIWGSKCR